MALVEVLTVSLFGWFGLAILLLLALALTIAMVGLVFQAWWWTLAQMAQAARWSRITGREVRKIGSRSHPFDEPELPKPAVLPLVMQRFRNTDELGHAGEQE
jgi:hypothetical protein